VRSQGHQSVSLRNLSAPMLAPSLESIVFLEIPYPIIHNGDSMDCFPTSA